MTNNPKSTKDAPPESPARDTAAPAETAPFTAFAAIFSKGVERLAEMQKAAVDLVANQTRDTIKVWKQASTMPSAAQGMFLPDVLDQGIEKMALAQKEMIDLVVEQNARLLEMANQRRDYTTKWVSGMAGMTSEAAERTVATQKILLDFAAEQNKVIAGAVKRQASSTPAAGVANTAVEAIQRNVDVAIQTQKELLETAVKPLKAAASSSAA